MKQIKLGEKILAFRKANHLTIKELSELTGLSSALLSQLERNIGNPTLSALQAVASVLGVSVSDLLEEENTNASRIMRKEDRKKLTYEGENHIIYDVLLSGPVKSRMELVLVTLAPHSKTNDGFVRCSAEEEIIYVEEGSVTVVFEHEEFELKEEDTIQILPGRAYLLRNDTEQSVKIFYIKNKSVMSQ